MVLLYQSALSGLLMGLNGEVTGSVGVYSFVFQNGLWKEKIICPRD